MQMDSPEMSKNKPFITSADTMTTQGTSRIGTFLSKYIFFTKKELDGFYFSVISCFLRNPTYHRSIFIALVYVRHTHLFYTRITLRFKLRYMLQKHGFAFFAHPQLCFSSFACKLLCRQSTLIAELNSCIFALLSQYYTYSK